MTPPVALTIAGSDSGGGAGVQADLKSFAANGVFGASAITALTAQNTVGVLGVHVTPPEFVDAQIAAVLARPPGAAGKTGRRAPPPTPQGVAHPATAGPPPHPGGDPPRGGPSGGR